MDCLNCETLAPAITVRYKRQGVRNYRHYLCSQCGRDVLRPEPVGAEGGLPSRKQREAAQEILEGLGKEKEPK